MFGKMIRCPCEAEKKITMAIATGEQLSYNE